MPSDLRSPPPSPTAHPRGYAWLRWNGEEVPFRDRASLLAEVLRGNISEDHEIRLSSDGPWVRAGDVLDAIMGAAMDAHAGMDHAHAAFDSGGETAARFGQGPSLPEGWRPHASPWRRYLARLFDFGFAGFALGLFLVLSDPELATDPGAEGLIWMASLFFAFPVLDGWILSRWNTSPGKWLLSVRTVRPRGERIPYGVALRRAYGVLIRGMWLGIPFLALIPLIRSYVRASRGEFQPWEYSARTYTIAGPLGPKVLVYLGAVALLLYLSIPAAQ